MYNKWSFTSKLSTWFRVRQEINVTSTLSADTLHVWPKQYVDERKHGHRNTNTYVFTMYVTLECQWTSCCNRAVMQCFVVNMSLILTVELLNNFYALKNIRSMYFHVDTQNFQAIFFCGGGCGFNLSLVSIFTKHYL